MFFKNLFFNNQFTENKKNIDSQNYLTDLNI